MNKRYSGVLAHIASLAGPYGVGTMGLEAINFARYLSQAGFSYWQVLPLTIVDEFNSPYKSLSAFAGNPAFIDPRCLVSYGLLTKQEAERYIISNNNGKMDYHFALKAVDEFLHLAWSRVNSKLAQRIEEFELHAGQWLKDYACFITAKKEFADLPWWQWPNQALAKHQSAAVENFALVHNEKLKFYYFEQWVFYRQWQDLKQQANEMGVGIIGDMPFYVDADSADVWANPEYFAVKGTKFTDVAGVPPDYFSATGQRWGNPLYNWQALQADDFAWWHQRLSYSLKLYDKIRIDHFRALVSYWAIPATSDTAINGSWHQAPYKDFYSKVLAKLPPNRIFAEDLGEIDTVTRKAINESGLPGMQIWQFCFTGHENSPDLPHNWSEKTVAYTGTHDNTTLVGWLWEMEEDLRDFVLRYIDFPVTEDWGQGGFDSKIAQKIIRQLWMSAARLAIVPVQDLCGFGGDTRMNTPGRVEGNWCYRLAFGALERINWRYFANLNKLYQRNNKFAD